MQLQRANRSIQQIHHPNQIVVGVSDVQAAASYADSGRLTKTRQGAKAILISRLSVSSKGYRGARPWIDPFDLIIVTVGNEQHAFVPGNAKRMLQTHDVAGAIDVAKLK